LGAHRNCADPGVKSAGEWIQQKIESESTATLISVFESTEKKIRLPSPTAFARERIQYWLTSLHASLDCYVWLFAEGYAHPQIILDGTIPPSLNFLDFLLLFYIFFFGTFLNTEPAIRVGFRRLTVAAAAVAAPLRQSLCHHQRGT
jgi:hypothetical protein